MPDDDRNFRERFDLALTAVVLAIVVLGSAAWIDAAIWRLYY